MATKLKNMIHNLGLELHWAFARKKQVKLRKEKIENRFLILMTGQVRLDERRSFGDEMMFLAICGHLYRTNPNASITVLRFDGISGHEYDFRDYRIKEIAFPSRDYTALSSYKEFRKLASDFSDVYLVGADCLDGAYWRRQTIQLLRFISIAGIVGCHARILGFSYNGTKDTMIRQELAKASSYCTLCVRDRISLDRLSQFVPHNIRLVADLAFPVDTTVLPVPVSDIPLHDTLKNWKNEGAVILAINICGWHWEDPNCYLNRFSSYLVGLAKENPSIHYLFLPHDNREGRISDCHTLSLLYDKLGAYHERILFCESLESGVQAKQLVRHADVLISGRMHLAIAALSQSVPTVSLVYQGKFEGLYEHYKFEKKYYFEPDDLQRIFEAVSEVLLNRDALSRHIASGNKDIFRLSEKNFEA